MSSSDFNSSGSLTVDLRQYRIKVNNNYPRTVTSDYYMLTHFELEYPRCHHTERTGDKGDRGNRRGGGGRDHTFVQYTTLSSTFFIPGIDGLTSYCIKCFSCKKWRYYENQCPEPTQYRTPNISGKNLAQIGRCLAQRSSGSAISDNLILFDS